MQLSMTRMFSVTCFGYLVCDLSKKKRSRLDQDRNENFFETRIDTRFSEHQTRASIVRSKKSFFFGSTANGRNTTGIFPMRERGCLLVDLKI